MIPVSEIFGNVLQGEGLYAGHPAIFIRTGGCNLKCPGFGVLGCDSYHSVDTKYRKSWKQYSCKELVEQVNKLLPRYEESQAKPIIVITGGEPTLYYEQLDDLVTYFITRGYMVQFETNATRIIDFERHPIYKKVSFSMSVKLACSGEPEYKRLNFEAISNILTHTTNSFFKFVVSTEADVLEARDILKEIPYYAIVYLMPMGETREELKKTELLTYEAAVKFGFRYSPRLHISMYDDERMK